MKKLFVSILAIALCTVLTSESLLAQKTTSTTIWKDLAKITFKKQYDDMLGFKVDVPVFSEDVKKMEGKVVEVKGYVIPVEGYKSHTEFVFSAYPYNMCFFCGGAGPETVMEVYAKEAIKYSPDPIIIKGKLELNNSDVNRLIYSLTDVVLVSDKASQ